MFDDTQNYFIFKFIQRIYKVDHRNFDLLCNLREITIIISFEWKAISLSFI